MAIVVPPPADDTIIDVTEEIRQNRRLTHYFIVSAPTQIILTPMNEVRSDSGAVRLSVGAQRNIQTFRLIPMSHTERPASSTSGVAGTAGGVQRKYEFTLLGEWDSVMAENDFWEDEQGQKWVVDALVSYNGYERKGLVMSYGRRPTHG